MTDRDALLAAIYADPADDTVRLAYADWLDENGDPDRAEFIRVQVEVESLRCPGCRGKWCAADIPGAVVYTADLAERVCERNLDRLRAIRDRENVLLAAHRREWLGGPKCGNCDGGWVNTARFPTGLTERQCESCRGTGYECWPLVETEVAGHWLREREVQYADASGKTAYRITSHFARGFVSRIKLLTEQFTEEVAGTIFWHHPTITEVGVPNHLVYPSGGNDTYYLGGLGSFPRKYWNELADHPSRSSVLAAASAVYVAWGRELAGLPPLPTA